MARIENIFKSEVKKANPHPKRNTKWIHYSKLRLDEGNYRFGDSEEKQQRTRERVESLADLIELDGEVLQELIVAKADTDEYKIIAGNHRYLACKMLVEERGKEAFAFLPCVIRNVSEARERFSKYSSNGYDNKEDYEIMREIEDMKELLTTYPEQFPDVATGRMVEKLSKKLKMPRSTVGEYLTISKNLGKEAMEKFETGELKKSAAVQMAALPKEEQSKLVSSGKLSHKEVKAYKEQKTELRNLEERKEQNGKSDASCSHHRIERDPVLIVGEKTGGNESSFPKMKNMEEREAFVNNYKVWSIWCRNELTEETFYRYSLPDGSAIIVKEYPYSDYWDSTKERIGKQLYLLLPEMKHFKNAEANMTEIKEHLKNLQKNL